jgi:hypothetical protein
LMHPLRTAMLHIRVRYTRCQQAFTGDVPAFAEAHATAPHQMP